MLIHAPGPALVYFDRAKVDAIVAKLNADADDGSSYAVKERVAGRFVIECLDAEGDFLGYL